MGQDGTVYCPRHPEKQIEYFCKVCHVLVCAKCMFMEHSGHELAELEDVTGIMKQNIKDLSKLLSNTRKINVDNVDYIEHKKSEVLTLKERQLQNIDIGFAEVIKGLEDRRDVLKKDFIAKYETEEQKFDGKLETLSVYNNDVENIQSIYDDLEKFVDRSSDAKILMKINEVSEFIQKSAENLETIAKAKGFDKADTQLDASLTPLSLNVEKVIGIITKFNMLPPANQKTEN